MLTFSKQQKLASILPHITALMSWLGSLSITIDVIRKYRKGYSKPMTYHWLMLGMSLYDMAFSGALMMTTWPVPADTPGAYMAFGTEASCKTQAFFIQLGIGVPFYNLCLCVYYYCFIVKNIRPSRILERRMHLLCNSFAFGTAVLSLVLDVFGFAGFWCWITEEHDNFRWGFFYGPVWVIIIFVSGIMTAIYYNLRKQENRQQRWSRYNSQESARRSSLSTIPRNNNEQGGQGIDQESLARNSDIRRTINNRRGSNLRNSSVRVARASDSVKFQAFWYVGSLLLTWFFLTIVRGMQAAGRRDSIPQWVNLAGATLVPIQGFFNYLIYIAPRYKQQRKNSPREGRFVTFLRVNPLFTGWKFCSGAPACAERMACFRNIQQGIASITHNYRKKREGGVSGGSSQEECDSDQNIAEEGQVVVCTTTQLNNNCLYPIQISPHH